MKTTKEIIDMVNEYDSSESTEGDFLYPPNECIEDDYKWFSVSDVEQLQKEVVTLLESKRVLRNRIDVSIEEVREVFNNFKGK